MFVDIPCWLLCTSLLYGNRYEKHGVPFLRASLICVTKPQINRNLSPNIERKGKILKERKKHHSTVDESSSEKQFCKSDAISFVV